MDKVQVELIVHKRRLDDLEKTVCGATGAKIALSSRVTCPECKRLMADGHQYATVKA